MARGKKQGAPAIPDIEWTTDLTWKLLAEAEKSENRKTLLGKKKDENTSKDTKIAVFKRIGSVILADSYALNPDTVGDRVKKRFDYLVNRYKHHACRLRTTGEGVQDDHTGYEPDEEHFDHYIPTSGPDDSTPKHIKSIWDEIVLKFVYFPELHRMLSSRPNVTPIVITTGVPAGRKTVHYQAPSKDENEPRVFSATQLQQIHTLQEALDAARAPSPASQSLFDSIPSSLDFDESEKENFLPSSTPKRVPSNSHPTSAPPSTRTPKSSDAIEKAKQWISKLPKKRTFEDVLANLQQQLLLEEFGAGIWEVDEYRMKLQELNNDEAVEVETPSAKKARYSPDWDEIE
ncbi:hypothetical protein EDB19DRAFT_1913186 [Suillus lakei]|nr:hypothetical protein EDB19DRAFT_1913186 [Suillus lakei]